MIGIFRQLLATSKILMRLVPTSKRRFMLFVSLCLSLVLLGFLVISCINKARADTPTPVPEESETDSSSDISPGFYYVPLISRGSWGYGPAYLRFDETTTGEPGYISEYEFTGVQGWYNYVEFTTLALGSINYDPSSFDHFVIGYYWDSDNITVSINSVSYNGQTYFDGETGFYIGDFHVQWSYALGNTVLGLTYEGSINDISSNLDIIDGHYLSLDVTYSVSAPDTVTMYGLASLIKEAEPQPTPAWLDPPSFPDVETDESIPGDTPSYNGILGAINSTLVWLGQYIKTAVEQLIGSWSDVQSIFAVIQAAFSPVSDIFDDLGDLATNTLNSLQAIPSSARIDFDGWTLTIPAAGTHGAVSGRIIPPIHEDVGVWLTQMGLTPWIRWGIRFCMLVGLLNYLYAMPKRILGIMSGRVELVDTSGGD